MRPPAFAATAGKIWWGRAWNTNADMNPVLNSAVSSQSCFALMRQIVERTASNVDAVLNTGADADHMGWSPETVYSAALRYLMMVVEFKSFNYAQMGFPFSNVAMNSMPSWHGVHLPFFLRFSVCHIMIGIRSTYGIAGDPRSLYLCPPGDEWNTGNQVQVHSDPAFVAANNYYAKRWVSKWIPEFGFNAELLFSPKEISANIADSLGVNMGISSDISVSWHGLLMNSTHLDTPMAPLGIAGINYLVCRLTKVK